jgi:hypothetical protein
MAEAIRKRRLRNVNDESIQLIIPQNLETSEISPTFPQHSSISSQVKSIKYLQRGETHHARFCPLKPVFIPIQLNNPSSSHQIFHTVHQLDQYLGFVFI